MNVIVIGCGKFGTSIASELEHAGYEVVVVDKDYQSFADLPDSFHGRRINGDAMDLEVLERAKIKDADAVILTSQDDTTNLVLAHMFKNHFNIDNVISLNTDPEFRFYYDMTGNNTISMVSWGTLKIEEILMKKSKPSDDSIETTPSEIFNVVLPDIGKPYSAIELQKVPGSIIFAITHDHITSKFLDKTEVKPGDILHMSSTMEGLRNFYEYLDQAAQKEKSE